MISTDGKLLDSEFQETKLSLLPGGGAEQCPDDWWNSICGASRNMIKRNYDLKDQIVAISCTSQWSGTVAVDKEGAHLAQAIIPSRAFYILSTKNQRFTSGPLNSWNLKII